MDIFIEFTGNGPATGLPLAADLEITIADDGICADFVLTNTTTAGPNNPDPLIDQLLFNLAGFDAGTTQLIASNFVYTPQNGLPVAGNWEFADSSGSPTGDFDHNSGGCGRFQYLINESAGNPDHRLRVGDQLSFTLCVIDPELFPTRRFTVDTFLLAPIAENGTTQAAISFQQLGPQGEDSDCLGGDFEEGQPE